ncbi:UDP-Glc:alpha-D-GlcNAc-diphosphoundecaprenol beta-1,3-glucosyltransferase WfgD [Vibrio chagasii]|nr:UDP-Glc:alpha-D-GlcNAc-diphosphoundecaprenol beta-1,3-glucosyltransferase WfgD [Vibrio chagasii]
MSVSIVMPMYNASKTIEDAIQSVINQTFSEWELIIVDDSSSDDSVELVKEIASRESRIKLVTLNENSGSPSKPRNEALKRVNYEFIAFLDADDLWFPNKLARQVDILVRNRNINFLCSGYEVIDNKNNIVGSFLPPPEFGYNDLLKHNSIGCLTAIFRREFLGEKSFPKCGHEDYALWLGMTRNGEKIYSIDEKLASYRLLENSVSSNKFKVGKFFYTIYRYREGFGFFTSMFMMIRYFIFALNKYERNNG